MTEYALCTDGARRAFQITGNNTFHDGEKAAAVTIAGKAVGGTVRRIRDGWAFSVNQTGKNAHLLVPLRVGDRVKATYPAAQRRPERRGTLVNIRYHYNPYTVRWDDGACTNHAYGVTKISE